MNEPADNPTTTSQAASSEKLTQYAKDLLAEIGESKLLPKLLVRRNNRLSSTAGRALHDSSTIELNRHLDQFPSEPEHTIKHELAHLLAQARAKNKRIAPHGAEWQQACADLSIPREKACHYLPLPRHKKKVRYIYSCPACHLKIKRVRKPSRYSACLACCRLHNKGHYHSDFQLVLLQSFN